MLGTLVDTGALLRTIAAASVSGVGIALIFSFAILGAARFVEYGRDGRVAAAAAFAVVAVVALVAAAAAVTVGIIVMTQK